MSFGGVRVWAPRDLHHFRLFFSWVIHHTQTYPFTKPRFHRKDTRNKQQTQQTSAKPPTKEHNNVSRQAKLFECGWGCHQSANHHGASRCPHLPFHCCLHGRRLCCPPRSRKVLSGTGRRGKGEQYENHPFSKMRTAKVEWGYVAFVCGSCPSFPWTKGTDFLALSLRPSRCISSISNISRLIRCTHRVNFIVFFLACVRVPFKPSGAWTCPESDELPKYSRRAGRAADSSRARVWVAIGQECCW